MFLRGVRFFAVLAALVVPLAIAGSAGAQAPKKQYTVTLAPSPTTGGTITETVTFSDQATSNQSIGSVQVIVPNGFTNVSVVGANANSAGATATQNSDGSWTVTCGTAAGNCAFDQNGSSSIQPGSTGSIQISMTTPASCSSNTYNFTASAHQANNFNSGGNILNPSPTTVSLTVNSSCTYSKMAFTTEPASVADSGTTFPNPSEQITGTAFTPPLSGGSPVKVQLEDASGNAVAVSGVPVTITIQNNAGTPTAGHLGGTTTENTDSNGVATFSDLTLDELGNGYTLKAANSDGSVSTISTAFSVAMAQDTLCPAGANCQVTTSGNSAFAQVTTNGGPNGGTLFEAVNDGTQLVCTGYKTLDTNTFHVGGTASINGGVWTETIIDVASTQSGAANVKASVQVCFGDTKRFTNSKNKPAAPGTLPDGSAGYIDLLPNCPQTNMPCHDRKADSSQPDPNGSGFDLTVVADIPPGFDYYSHN